MAEAVVSNLCSKLLTAIDSVLGAETEPKMLQEAIERVKNLSVDAEMNHESSSSVKNWFKKVADLLYEAEDLIDEVIASDEKKGNKLWKLLRENSIGPLRSTKDRIKSITERIGCLLDCEVKAHGRTTIVREYVDNVVVGREDDKGKAVESLTNESVEEEKISVTAVHGIGGIGKTTLTQEDVGSSFVGRKDDKKKVVRFLTNDSIEEEKISVTALLGIGGIGKTTLAREVWKDKEVINVFEGRRWWASISNVFGEKEIIEKIFQSMTMSEADHVLTFMQLQSEIRGRIVSAENFLLVLDGVCDENHATWLKIMRSLGLGAKKSRIMVTTRSESVARAMGANKTYELPRLSKRDSWDLFRKLIPTTPDQEKLPIRVSLGRQIVKNCSGIPLVIKTIASLLSTRTSLEEWKSFKRYVLIRMKSSADPSMFALKLCYYWLLPNLKHCFAYCFLFPKGFSIDKDKLIYLWIAQGFVESIEAGHLCLMELLRTCFLYVTKEDEFGEIVACGMHESFHNLAQIVAGEESVILSTKEAEKSDRTARHISLNERIDSSWEIPPSFLNGKRLRSSLFTGGGSVSSKVVDQQLFSREFLRALTLQRMNIKEIPSSIDKLKHLKYLDFSENRFKLLPNSITSLFNLLALDVSGCRKLGSLPDNLKKLSNLSYLNTRECDNLKHMPPEFEKLISLQHLTCFKVGKPAAVGKRRTLVALANLKLKGALEIEFHEGASGPAKEDALSGLSELKVLCLRNHCMVALAFPPNLVKLELHSCKLVGDLQDLEYLSNLKSLVVCLMPRLKYILSDPGGSTTEASGLLFPANLERLELSNLPKLEAWSRKHMAPDRQSVTPFPALSSLKIEKCVLLESIPSSAKLETLEVDSVRQEVVKPFLSSRSSPSLLRKITLVDCFGLESFPGEDLASLRVLEVRECSALKKLSLPSELEELTIESCRQLILWEEQSRGFNWESLHDLRLLRVAEIPDANKLPSCLKKLQDHGRLRRIGLSSW